VRKLKIHFLFQIFSFNGHLVRKSIVMQQPDTTETRCWSTVFEIFLWFMKKYLKSISWLVMKITYMTSLTFMVRFAMWSQLCHICRAQHPGCFPKVTSRLLPYGPGYMFSISFWLYGRLLNNFALITIMRLCENDMYGTTSRPWLVKVEKYRFMSIAEGDLAIVQTALFIFWIAFAINCE
jgi:hypothetical protein